MLLGLTFVNIKHQVVAEAALEVVEVVGAVEPEEAEETTRAA